MTRGDLPKRIIAEIYSRAADTLYEPIVVRGTFRMFASDLEELVLRQGRAAVRAAKGGPILDLPVGTAHFTSRFAEGHPGLIVGVDIAHGMVVATKDRAETEGLKNLVATRADAHSLPFATASFAAVMCTNGLQVMPGLERTLDELHRVLAIGGLLQVSVVNLPVGGLLPGGAEVHLPTFFKSRDALITALRDANFTVENVETSRLATLIQATK